MLKCRIESSVRLAVPIALIIASTSPALAQDEGVDLNAEVGVEETPEASPEQVETDDVGETAEETSEAVDDEAPASVSCSPQCRAGYACVEGDCQSLCNPACPGGTSCTANAECAPVAEATATLPPPVVPAPITPPEPRYRAAVNTTWIAFGITLVGAVLVGVGASSSDCYGLDDACYRSPAARSAGILSIVGGMTMLAIAMPIAIVRRNRHRDWESQYGASEVTLRLHPMFATDRASRVGGLQLSGSF